MLAPGNGRVAVTARGIEAAPPSQSCVAAILSPMKSSTKERRIVPGSRGSCDSAPYRIPPQKHRRIAPSSRVAASLNVSPGQRPRSGHSPGYRSDTHNSELRSCDSAPYRIPPQKHRRIAPSSRVAASLNVSPRQRPRSGHSPGYRSDTPKSEPRSCDSVPY